MNQNQASQLVNPFQAWNSLAFNSAQMMATSAQVVGMRVQRMLVAGVLPGTSDRAEMNLMSSEKLEAAAESAQAMAQGVMALNQQLFAMAAKQALASLPMMLSLATSFTPARFAEGQQRVVRAAIANSNEAGAKVSAAVPRIAAKGIRPIHSVARANGKRLSKRKR